MVLSLAPAIGVLLGLACGGHLMRLAALRLRYAWLVLPALAVQLLLIFAPPVPPDQGHDPLRLWLPLSFVPLTAFVVANVRLPGMPLVLVGLLANAGVIVSNGGLMPTNAPTLTAAGMSESVALAQAQPGIRLPSSKDVMLPVAETRLWWLSDTLVSPPIPRRKVMSVGDLFVAVGVITLAFQITRGGAAGTGRPAAPQM
ncbi:MAG TPA: DUF5317 domain-containing protein [Chloroflexota bacterium]|nr:DUF5317 domain-containing protein [Chloroflexota bacterium]